MKLICEANNWFWQRWDRRKSQLFSTRSDAIRAYRRGLCKWEE